MNLRRASECLNGTWDFAWLGEVDLLGVDPAAITFAAAMPVPGCFDALPAWEGRRGVAAYRVALVGDATRRSRLVLDSVHHTCRVLLDGQDVGGHHGGFVPFALDLGKLDAAPHRLVVLVDNRFDAQRSPLHGEYFDWYHYGGIARGARVERLPGLWIERVRFTTLDHATRRVRIELDTAGHGQAEWSIDLAGRFRAQGRAEAGQTVACELVADGLPLWSCSSPCLHRLDVSVGEDCGVLEVGLRTVKIDGNRILLNGEAVQLCGVCRHEVHLTTGHAVTPMQLHQDLQLLQELNVNFVRGSHYPQHPAFLELCDRAGILVWSEGIAWNPRVEHLTDPNFTESHLAHLDEMVHASQHHPCIVLWGVFNEGDSNFPASRPAYEAALARLRQLDASRPVTFASHRPLVDVCLDLADVIAINTYPGWYDGTIESATAHLDRIADYLDAHEGARGKPRIISEIGAGALYGWRDPHGARWSETYQARLFEAVLPGLCDPGGRWNGVSLWQFSDIRTSEATSIILGRPRGFNNKGLVDEYRRKKEAFSSVARIFRDAL